MLCPRMMTRVAVWVAATAAVVVCDQDMPRRSGLDCPQNSTTCYASSGEPACSGRGICSCGECICGEQEHPDEIVSGRFCECTNFLCNRINGQLCGGRAHGECECNKCKCNPGWTGPDCMCEQSWDNCINPTSRYGELCSGHGICKCNQCKCHTSVRGSYSGKYCQDCPSGNCNCDQRQDNCINPESGSVCSGQGICECNQCKCYEGFEGRYSGKFCEDCPTCKGKCIPYKDCVQCQAFQTGKYTEEECITKCTMFNATRVDRAEESEEGERLCTFFDENDCRFKFVYGYRHHEPYVYVQQSLECPPSRGFGPYVRSSSQSVFTSVSVAVVFLSLIPLAIW